MSQPIRLQMTLAGRRYEVDPTRAHNLAISLKFLPESGPIDGTQPNAFHLPPARARAARAANFVGDTRLGGSANCADIHLNPHGNGTHTECVGHVVDEAVAVGELALQALIPAVILSVFPERLGERKETYDGTHTSDDHVVTRRGLEQAWHALQVESKDIGAEFCEAIILRTLPNSGEKRARQYGGSNPPYPTREAVGWLMEMGCAHLVLDLPSLDREVDQNRLPNHHLFFDLPLGAQSLEGAAPSPKTVTEMAFIPDSLADGAGFLNLQLPRFALDAAPSRPLFFKII